MTTNASTIRFDNRDLDAKNIDVDHLMEDLYDGGVQATYTRNSMETFIQVGTAYLMDAASVLKEKGLI